MKHAESIILSKRPLHEADLLVTFFSKEDGKVSGVARNAKKSRKRFGGLLETGYVLNMNYSTLARSDLASITSATLMSPTAADNMTLASTVALWLAIEFAARFLPDREANPQKFELLRRFVVTVHEGRLTRSIILYFLMRWITLCGYMPNFDCCIRCGDCGEFKRFSASFGGLLCRKCSSNATMMYEFKSGSLNVLKKITRSNLDFKVDDSVFENILRFTFYYSMVILGRPLNVENYINMLMEVE